MPDLVAMARAYCLKHDLLTAGSLLVAVSGGADSLTVLHILLRLRDEFGLQLHVATLDHGLRGAAGAADAEYVRARAEQWGIPVTVGQADVNGFAASQRMGIEAAAREVRYEFLKRTAQQIDSQQIALGHNRDDQVETVLLHVLRGTGLVGLRGMLPKSDRGSLTLIRPLLDTPRAAIDAYARDQELHPRIDATNTDTVYLRNRLRHEILPLLRTINPTLDEALIHMAETARADYEVLLSELNKLPKADRIPREHFAALPLSIQRLAIREIARGLVDQVPTFMETEAALEWIVRAKAGERLTLPSGLHLGQTMDMLWFGESADPGIDAPALDKTISLTVPDEIGLAEGWRLNVTRLAPDADPVDYFGDPLCGVLSLPQGAALAVRTWRAGDRFEPGGMGGRHQKLSDTFINMKVPASWRGRVPLLTVDGTIAWFVAPTPDGLRARAAEPFAVRAQWDSVYVVRCWRDPIPKFDSETV